MFCCNNFSKLVYNAFYLLYVFRSYNDIFSV